MNDQYTIAGQTRGASLSFKPYIKLRVLHMLVVVVPRTMGSIVVSLLLFSAAPLVLPAGTLALPYHLNHFLLFIVIIFINEMVQHILFVEDILKQIFSMVYFLILYMLHLPVVIGVMVPLYHLD